MGRRRKGKGRVRNSPNRFLHLHHRPPPRACPSTPKGAALWAVQGLRRTGRLLVLQNHPQGPRFPVGPALITRPRARSPSHQNADSQILKSLKKFVTRSPPPGSSSPQDFLEHARMHRDNIRARRVDARPGPACDCVAPALGVHLCATTPATASCYAPSDCVALQPSDAVATTSTPRRGPQGNDPIEFKRGTRPRFCRASGCERLCREQAGAVARTGSSSPGLNPCDCVAIQTLQPRRHDACL